MKKRGILCLVMVLLLTGCIGTTNNIRFGAAGIGGMYHAFADTFGDLLTTEQEEKQIEVKTTAGSAANLRLLSEGYIQMAIAQDDMARDAYQGTSSWSNGKKYQGYRAVAGLYMEACQIVVRDEADIQSVDDLLGKKVSVGEKESGTEESAKQILSVYGIWDNLGEKVHLDYTDAAQQLRDGKIDGFFCTAGIDTTVISELAKQCDIRLLSLDEKNIDKMTTVNPAYSRYIIPAGTYNGQKEDVLTVGVRALLLVSDNLDKETVEWITKTLFDKKQEIQYSLPADIALDENTAVQGIGIPFHEGAVSYYQSCGITV